MLVVHHADADGRCAAAVVYKAFLRPGDMRFIEMDYNKAFPLRAVQRDEEVYIVDFSLKPEVMELLLKITPHVYWCDHHKTAQGYDYGREIKGYRDFSEKGLCGAECTWKYLFQGDEEAQEFPFGLFLLGDYDAWRLTQGRKTFQFYEGLKLRSQEPTSTVWDHLLQNNHELVENICKEGEAAIQYRDLYCADMIKSYGYETEIDGYRAFACNIYRFGSQGFGKLFDEFPVIISYVHDGKKFVVSLYSKTVDVSVIAKSMGGGGHSGAAGFVCVDLPFVPKPADRG
jgi:oligoribonuclease NrnB/cAMP/cGMP phosphodiesterase (DHH superfamily)